MGILKKLFGGKGGDDENYITIRELESELTETLGLKEDYRVQFFHAENGANVKDQKKVKYRKVNLKYSLLVKDIIKRVGNHYGDEGIEARVCHPTKPEGFHPNKKLSDITRDQ